MIIERIPIPISMYAALLYRFGTMNVSRSNILFFYGFFKKFLLLCCVGPRLFRGSDNRRGSWLRRLCGVGRPLFFLYISNDHPPLLRAQLRGVAAHLVLAKGH